MDHPNVRSCWTTSAAGSQRIGDSSIYGRTDSAHRRDDPAYKATARTSHGVDYSSTSFEPIANDVRAEVPSHSRLGKSRPIRCEAERAPRAEVPSHSRLGRISAHAL